MAQSISVLFVEDHASYRQALGAVMAVERDLRVVAEADNPEAAGAAAARTGAMVALVDLDLPYGDGVEAIAEIRASSPATACVVLSALTDEAELGRAVEAGASAILHKSVEIPALLDAIRAVAAGAVLLPPQETTARLRALAANRERDWRSRLTRQSLTQRELEILQHLAFGQDNRAIAGALHISPDTVQTHVRNILGKLAVGSRLEAVVAGLRLGLVEPPR
jgi:DNA-binding NarL/FixJ family response regulator